MRPSPLKKRKQIRPSPSLTPLPCSQGHALAACSQRRLAAAEAAPAPALLATPRRLPLLKPRPPLPESRSPRISRAAPASDCQSRTHPRPSEPRSRIRYRRSRDRRRRARRSRDRRSRARRSRDRRSRWRVVSVPTDPFVSNRLQPKVMPNQICLFSDKVLGEWSTCGVLRFA